MRINSEEAWSIASKYGYALASETRDLAAEIDALIHAKIEAAAKVVEHQERWGPGRFGVAGEIRKLAPVIPESN